MSEPLRGRGEEHGQGRKGDEHGEGAEGAQHHLDSDGVRAHTKHPRTGITLLQTSKTTLSDLLSLNLHKYEDEVNRGQGRSTPTGQRWSSSAHETSANWHHAAADQRGTDRDS